MRKLALGFFLAFWMLFGGMLFYNLRWVKGLYLVTALGLVGLTAGLSALRFASVANRFSGWGASLAAMWAHQPHSHNIAIHLAAEFGLLGLLALVFAVVGYARLQPRHGWPAALLAGLLAHGLIDYPLYFPGPVLVFAAVAGVLALKCPAITLLPHRQPVNAEL